MDFDPRVKPEVRAIFYKMVEAGMTQKEMSKLIAIDPDMMSKVRAGTRKMSSHELVRARKALGIEGNKEPDLPPVSNDIDYVEINVTPSYAGAGGGGTGEGERMVARLPRKLIADELRGRPSDFELIDIRGDSMLPDFKQGDQVLYDKRDRDPTQPGYFVIWGGDTYLIKNLERKRDGIRAFSSNMKYSDEIIDPEQLQILGRPVWFARRL